MSPGFLQQQNACAIVRVCPRIGEGLIYFDLHHTKGTGGGGNVEGTITMRMVVIERGNDEAK